MQVGHEFIELLDFLVDGLYDFDSVFLEKLVIA